MANQSSMSAKSTSTESPSEIAAENPIERLCAHSSTAALTAPDCDTSARSPASGRLAAKLANSFECGATTPRQLGPTTRSPRGRVTASSAAL